MSFQILDGKKYPLQVTNQDTMLPYWRYEHRATIGWNTREFIVFVDHLETVTYIEEIVGGHLEKVNDEPLHQALTEFAFTRGFTEASPPPPRKLEVR